MDVNPPGADETKLASKSSSTKPWPGQILTEWTRRVVWEAHPANVLPNSNWVISKLGMY